MAAGDPYITAEDLAGYIASVNNENAIDTTNRQTELNAAANAISRRLEQHCGRVFWDAESATARVYAADDWGLISVDDFSTTTGLVVATDTSGNGTFDATWASTDYQVEPVNGVVNGAPGWPYWKIRAIESRTFPVSTRSQVQVTARWGWAAVPDEVKQAALIHAHRVYKRAESPEGVAGFGDFGAIRLSRLDNDVQDLLAPYRRDAMLVA